MMMIKQTDVKKSVNELIISVTTPADNLQWLILCTVDICTLVHCALWISAIQCIVLCWYLHCNALCTVDIRIALHCAVWISAHQCIVHCGYLHWMMLHSLFQYTVQRNTNAMQCNSIKCNAIQCNEIYFDTIHSKLQCTENFYNQWLLTVPLYSLQVSSHCSAYFIKCIGQNTTIYTTIECAHCSAVKAKRC